MKLAYNPSDRPALTGVSSDNKDIIFDLSGIAIYARGVKFDGKTPTVFKKHTSANTGGYDGLVPAPSYADSATRFLREDGTWVIPDKTTSIHWDNIDGKPDVFNPSQHIHTTDDIRSLTNYAKATSAAALATTDTLNVALGKLEYKSDLGVTAYNWYKSVTDEDTDEHINKWNEIVSFLNGVTDTTLNGILTNFVNDLEVTGTGNAVTNVSKSNNKITVTKGNSFLPLSGGTINGLLELKGNRDTKLVFNNTDGEKYQIISFREDGVQYGEIVAYELYINFSFPKATINNKDILHSGNYTDYTYSKSTIDTKLGGYLPLSGGTLTGALDIISAKYGYEGNYGLNMNNSDIIGANAIYFGDTSNSNQEGLHFIRSNGNYDTLRAMNGVLMFATNIAAAEQPTSNVYNTVYHTGNLTKSSIGLGNVDNTSDSNKNVNSSVRLRSMYGIDTSNNLSGRPTTANLTFTDKSLRYFLATSSMTEGKPPTDSCVLHLAWDNTAYGRQIAIGTNEMYYRYQNKDTSWNEWRQIAFTDSNVASATKLQTARTIWGQSFDGTADVSGALTMPNHSAIRWYDTSGNGHRVIQLTNSNEVSIGYDTAVAGYLTRIGGYAIKLKYGTSYTDGFILNSSGNVGIGTTSPSYKLDVNGTARASGFIKSGSSSAYVLTGDGGHKLISDFAAAGSLGNYLPLAGGTMNLGEGLKFHADENYFGTNSDARIISLLDGNGTTCDGGLIIDECCTSNGTTTITELLRIRDSEFKWKGQNILHSGNYSSYLGYIGTTAVQSTSAAQALTGITTATFSGAVTLSGTASSTAILKFSRSGASAWNYIIWPGDTNTNCKLAFGYSNSSAASYYYMTSASFNPVANNVRSLGTSSVRWSNVYSVLGNFSGLITATSGVQIGSTADIGWYLSSSRISAGKSTARGVNVGSLLVSNAWTDYTKVPSNGIYSKGDITTAGTMSSANYQIGTALELKTDDTACQTTVFGSNESGYRMRIVRQATSSDLNTKYSPTLVLSSLDTHAYIAWSYSSDNVWVGGGAGNKWNWRSKLVTSANYGSYLGYIGTTAVQSSSKTQELTGITNATMSGTTTTKNLVVSGVNQYREAGGIILNNSDIWGLNAIYTSGLANAATEGYQFKRTNGNYDSLWCKDGVFYFSPNGNSDSGYSSNYPVIVSVHDSNGYPALLRGDGSSNWIRISNSSSYGLLPNQSGGAGSGHGYLGTSSWYFKYAYIDQIYGYLNGNISGSASYASNADKVDGYHIAVQSSAGTDSSTIYFVI